MPELPEVETLCRQMQQVLPGKTIETLAVLDPRLCFAAPLTGQVILSVERRGKGVAILLDDGRLLRLHLRMTGRLLWGRPDQTLPPHSRFRMAFGEGLLTCIDPRRFATLACQETDTDPAGPLDPLRPFRVDRLASLAANRRMPIKAFLMDQRFIGGIGNIYACEILYAAGLSPWRPAGDLTGAEWGKVAGCTVSILTQAVACRGTSVSDWRDLFGEPGSYQLHLQVYRKGGRPCPRCGAAILRRSQGGRATYFCPACQEG